MRPGDLSLIPGAQEQMEERTGSTGSPSNAHVCGTCTLMIAISNILKHTGFNKLVTTCEKSREGKLTPSVMLHMFFFYLGAELFFSLRSLCAGNDIPIYVCNFRFWREKSQVLYF